MTNFSLQSRRSLSLVVGLVLIIIGALPWEPALAQTDEVFKIEIVGQPVWHDPDDRFDLAIEITNQTTTSLGGYRLVIGVFDRVTTRSDLHSKFDLSTSLAPSSFPIEYSDVITPGEVVAKTVTNPLSDSSLATETENGVYPLRISLIDALGATLGQVTTQLLYYPSPPEDPALAMNATFVLPINDLPARSPDGTFGPDDNGAYPLEEALAEDGWLSGMLKAIDDELGESEIRRAPHGNREPAVPPHLELAIIPGARLLEELDDMSDGYDKEIDGEVTRVRDNEPEAKAAQQALGTIRALVSEGAVQAITAPYSFADLPSIARFPNAIAEQLVEASTVYEEVLGDSFPQDWVFAPGGRVDLETLAKLKLASGGTTEHTLFDRDALEPLDEFALSGCPNEVFSDTCPVEVTTDNGTFSGYSLDLDIQARISELTSTGANRADVQRFFAETSMIREEEPSVGGRIIEITVPSTWHPSPQVFATFLQGMSRAPWLEMMTPDDGLVASDDTTDRGVLAVLERHAGQPEDGYFDELVEAGKDVESFGTIGPPATLLSRLRRNVLESFSRVWWGDELDRGHSYATESTGELMTELGKISVSGANTTLSSRNGQIQVLVTNDTGYEVTANIELNSEYLTVNDPDAELVIKPEDQPPVLIDVTAQTSGAFLLEIRLRTPDGELAIGEPEKITITSTEYNQIALAITFGALAFLVFFYAIRGFRRRRSRQAEESEVTAE